MKDTDLAYLAGQIDADGTIGITRRRDGAVIGRFSLYTQDAELVRWCKEVTGVGSISVCRFKTTGCYQWQPAFYASVDLLRKLLPYLRTKKQQAELVIELFDTRTDHQLSAEEDEKFLLRNKQLNSRLSMLAKSLAKQQRGPSTEGKGGE